MLLFNIEGISAELGISRGHDGELVLRASSCETLLRQTEALCQWRLTAEQDFKSTEPSRSTCRKLKKGGFEIRTRDCLPELARFFHQKPLHRSGPNCWGTAMSFHGLSLKPRFVWSQEMLYWMSSPLCRKLGPGEEKRPGDVVNIFGPEYINSEIRYPTEGRAFQEALYPGRWNTDSRGNGPTGYQTLMHSVTYLTPELTFGKDSPRFDDRFYFHPFNEAYARPRESSESCRENQELAPYLNEKGNEPRDWNHDSSCAYFSTVSRCEDIRGHFSRQNLSAPDQAIFDETLELQKLQESLFPLVTTAGYSLSSSEIEQISERALSAREKALAELKTGKAPGFSIREMLLTWNYFSAAGLLKSLDQAAAGRR